jgi:putative transposase
MQAHSQEYPIALMCRALEVSESSYHAWSKREVSQRAQEDQVLADQRAQIFQANRGVYGGHVAVRAFMRSCTSKASDMDANV